MYTILMIFAGCVGLIVTGAAFYTVWSVMDMRKQQQQLPIQQAANHEPTVEVQEIMRTWTAMDFASIAVFLVGIMLLIADLFAVIRDRDEYPYYHYGYLLCAIIFVIVGMMFMVVRLGVIVRSAPKTNPASTFSDNNKEPDQAE